MRVAVYTLTRDRFEYTRHCFKTLREKAGYQYDHYVVDNHSEDETVGWLNAEMAENRIEHVIFNPANFGNAIGNNQAVACLQGYDLVIRMDNDCEVVTDGLIARVVDFYQHLGKFEKRHIVSPRVEGIVNQPGRGRNKWFGEHLVGYVSLVGGIFRVTPFDIIKQYHWPETQSKVNGEESICTWFRGLGGEVGYLEHLVVNHYETTDGQALRYPEYHKRKCAEA